MRSRTSYFNRTVFLNDLERWWPLAAGYALLWFLILPLTRLTEYDRGMYDAQSMLRESLGITAVGGYWSAFFTAILFAMAAFSYLTNPRATNGLHAFPARRETLFVTHYLAGLCGQLAAQTVAVLLTAAILAAHGAFDARVTGLMLLSLLLPTVFFYSFGVLCMVFTGQMFAAPVFYGALNVLVVSMEMLVKIFAGNFLYGWAEPQKATLLAFSPICKLVAVDVDAAYYEDRLVVDGLDWLWIYAAVGVVLAALALTVYRRRHSEATGSTVAIYWARPVFRYGMAFCAALALGQLLYYLFFGQFRANGNYSLAGSLLCMAFAGLLGFFTAEMLLKKSVRVLRSGWRGALAVTAALVALGAVMGLDLTGYEGFVPDPDAVESVSVDFNVYGGGNYCSFTATDAETVRLVEAVHRALVKDKRFQQSGSASNRSDVRNGFFFLDYNLKNGDTVRRSYEPIILDSDTLNDPDSPASALTALYNDPNVAIFRALGRWGYKRERDPRRLNGLRFTGGSCDVSRWNGDTYLGEDTYDLSPAEAKRLYDAVLRDVAAGRLTASLFEGAAAGLTVYLYATYLDTPDDASAAAPSPDEDARKSIDFELSVTERMTESLAVLRSMGIE